MLARQLTVRCGNIDFEWSCLENFFKVPKAVRTLEDIELEDLEDSKKMGVEFARSLVNEKASREDSIQRLSYLLTTFGGWQCKEPKDRVYGLLGLVPERSRVIVDYSKTMEQIFFDVLRKVIEVEDYSALESHLDFARYLWVYLSLSEISFDDIESMVEDKFQEVKKSHRPNVGSQLAEIVVDTEILDHEFDRGGGLRAVLARTLAPRTTSTAGHKLSTQRPTGRKSNGKRALAEDKARAAENTGTVIAARALSMGIGKREGSAVVIGTAGEGKVNTGLTVGVRSRRNGRKRTHGVARKRRRGEMKRLGDERGGGGGGGNSWRSRDSVGMGLPRT
ncbi:hypothetical protein H2201_008830 [Coniosporium apollinis]|uniref:Uncharacterized protein n=1 Tax=Coniosporium apollinis TaxID=61459 RepID=A0ABQ9NG32_9PEZI|nr:hypothetical protein H2201_008830 [Coniosporium apollinis]